MKWRIATWALAVLVVVGLWGLGVAKSAPKHQREVRLEHGKAGSFEWSISTHRGRGKNGGRRPCLTSAFDHAPAAAGFAGALTLCGTLNGSQILVANSIGEAGQERTILAVAFPLKVASVRLRLAGGGVETLRLRRVGGRQARVAKVQRFSYGAVFRAKPFCLRGFAAFDAGGALVSDGRWSSCR